MAASFEFIIKIYEHVYTCFRRVLRIGRTKVDIYLGPYANQGKIPFSHSARRLKSWSGHGERVCDK